jgi:hypothetical protein
MYDNLFKHININPSNIHIPSVCIASTFFPHLSQVFLVSDYSAVSHGIVQGDFEVKDPDNIESDPQILAFCEWYEVQNRLWLETPHINFHCFSLLLLTGTTEQDQELRRNRLSDSGHRF